MTYTFVAFVADAPGVATASIVWLYTRAVFGSARYICQVCALLHVLNSAPAPSVDDAGRGARRLRPPLSPKL